MKEEHRKWYSYNLGFDVDMLVFGERGRPVILFPTSNGRYYQNKDHGLIDAISWFINEGLVRVYCPDSYDWLCWYNKGVHPAERARNYNQYDKMLLEELVPWATLETGNSKAIMAGCSFGGYHAANFAFKHPEKVSHLFPMSGIFDIRRQTDGFYNDDIYYNNPVDFLPGSNQPDLWQMGIALGTAEFDICLQSNEILSTILRNKNINHWLDIRAGETHDWPVWKAQFPHYLSTI